MIRGGAHAMRRDGKGGMLASGYDADLILVDLNTLAFTPQNDLRRQLIYCEDGSSVVLTMIDGHVVAEHGKVQTVDEEEIKSEIRDFMPDYRVEHQPTLDAAKATEPYFHETYMKAVDYDVGLNRWAGPMR